jgi:hypothetical protein
MMKRKWGRPHFIGLAPVSMAWRETMPARLVEKRLGQAALG